MTPEDMLRFRRDLNALLGRLEELRSAIEHHSEAIHAAQETRDEVQRKSKPTQVLVSYDEKTNASQNAQNTTQQKIAKWTKRAVYAAIIYATIAALQWRELHKTTIQLQRQIKDYESSERAILTVAVDISGNQTELTFVVKNVGHGPAVDIVTPIDPGYASSNLSGEPNDLESKIKPVAPSETGFSLGEGAERRFQESLPPVSEMERLPVESRDYLLYMNVAYRDTFGTIGHAYGCAYWNWKHHQFRQCYVSHYGEDNPKKGKNQN